VRSAFSVVALFSAVGLSFSLYRYLDYVANRERISFWEPFIWEMTGAWFAALLFPFVARLARRFPLEPGKLASRIPIHIAGLAGYSIAHTSLLWISRVYLYPLVGFGYYDYGVMRARYPMEFFHDLILYPLLLVGIYFYDRRVRGAQLEAKLAAARLENLRLQIQPHFLFNALNTISAVVYEDPRKADAMIARLSDMLRRTITDSESQTAPLEREVETLELYLEIMRLRFEDKLSVDIRVAPDVQKALAPHLLLQPLVENSIRHGADPRSNSVSVVVTAERDGATTRVRVRDHGRGLPEKGIRRGTGLSNTAERLERLYGPRHKLEFQNCDDGGLLVTVAFPYQE
jgi:two-component system, LytTR family, sensor kinase